MIPSRLILAKLPFMLFFNPQNIEDKLGLMSRLRDASGGMLDGEPIAYVVLGGGHDLSDNIERLGGGTCEYLTVETKMYSQLSRLAGAE